MIEIRDLSFGYGERPVLQHVNFSCGEGRMVAVLGPNGIGKSTLFKCLLGFLKNYTGEICLSGREIRTFGRKEMAGQTAYIPQSAEAVFNYTVMDTVLMGTTGRLKAYETPGAAEKETARRVMEDLEIWDLRDRGISRISGGERQLALIARAMAQEAKVLIMDEPTANLDYGNQYRVLKKVRALAEAGYTILWSTHNPDHALHFATDVLALMGEEGCVSGPAEDVLTEALIRKIYRIPAAITEIQTDAGPIRSCIPLMK